MTYLSEFANYQNNRDGISLDELSAQPDSEWSGTGFGLVSGLYGVGAMGAKGVGLASASVLDATRYVVPDQYESFIDKSQDFVFKNIVEQPAEKRLEFMSHNKTTASQIAYGLTEGLGSMIYGGPAGGAITQGVSKSEEVVAEGGSLGKAYAKGAVTGGAFYLGAKVASAAPVLPGSGVVSTIAQKAVTGGAINTSVGLAQRTAEQGIEAATDGKFNTGEVLNYTNIAVDFGLGSAFGVLGKTNSPEFKDLPIEQKDASLSVVEDSYIESKIPEALPKEARDIQLDLLETERALDENRSPVYKAEKELAIPETVPSTEAVPIPKPTEITEQVLGEYEGINLDEMAKQFDDNRQILDDDGNVQTFGKLKEMAVKDIEESKTTIDKFKQVVECLLGGK